MGQLAYFIEFLTLTGLWSGWQSGCPLSYTSPNAPTKAEVLGTWLLSVLSGHKRYSHVTAIRCDGVNPGLLGMKKVISEDALRRALTAIPEAEGAAWLDGHLSESVALLLDAPWILNIDSTVKPLYGKQEGAVVSYNPKKPGRPSHSYHTYLMAGLRLVVGAEVKAGNEHSGSHTLPGLLKILDGLPPGRKPKIVRGDCGFGTDAIMVALEEREQPYLFKLKLTKNVKRHIERLFREAGWRDAGQGWEGKDGELKLTGWEVARRVIVLRRPLQGEMLVAQEDDGQQLLGFIQADRKAGKHITGYEYAVMVTNLDAEILSLGQLYRDRADAENAFDELKNQWGWGGFTTHDLHRCQLSARAVALIYNWWSLFVRLASPEARREAITSRPWLMSSVGRKTEHAGQTTITLTGLHAHFSKAKQALMRVSAWLKAWGTQAAEQFNPTSVWSLCCDHLKHSLAQIGPPQALQFLTNHADGIV
ncbi:transposase [Ottowia testudinis]|uniref:Transposase n=2 Tax=Ottowia testudinis TaxID=2816950 RepID=A0A975H4X7_9BURK|nr:transposase [Ottowia testudinis]